MRVLGLILLVALGDGRAGSGGVMGDWVGPTKGVVRVYSCGSSVCAKIVKLPDPAPEKTDGRNPDARLRGRTLCGLNVGTGFRRTDADHLAGGRLYDPQTGKSYSGTMVARGDELKLRGFVGISLFGRSEVWHRVGAVDAGACR